MTIDRAIEILNPDHREHYDGLEEVNEACRMGMEALKRQLYHPLDAVPVVRCRDCKWFCPWGSRYDKCFKAEGLIMATEDFFCSYGQRRDQSADVCNMGHFAGGGKTEDSADDADQH